MIYLFLAIIFSALIAFILKYSETSNLNRYAVTSANYFVAFLVSFVFSFRDKLFYVNTEGFTLSNCFTEIKGALSQGVMILSPEANLLWAVISGILGGVFYFSGFIFIQKSIDENGVSISGAFAKLGILIPMLIALFLWKEVPNLLQFTGISLALFSMASVNFSLKDFRSLKGFSSTLVIMFLAVGFAEFSNKFFQKYGIINYKSLFLFIVFLTAFIISIYFTVTQKKQLKKKDVITGVLVGIPNMFTSYFLILSFNYIKTTIVFPIYSAGSVVLIALGGRYIFGEKLETKDKFAILLTIIAVILININ